MCSDKKEMILYSTVRFWLACNGDLIQKNFGSFGHFQGNLIDNMALGLKIH